MTKAPVTDSKRTLGKAKQKPAAALPATSSQVTNLVSTPRPSRSREIRWVKRAEYRTPSPLVPPPSNRKMLAEIQSAPVLRYDNLSHEGSVLDGGTQSQGIQKSNT